ncbi:hypothetical protein PR003_g3297 [Phytophthora rubi]|nr:hypothetical protein PR003_g3297 [Phytophthora rubi]
MHYAENRNTYYKLKDEVLADWKKVPQLKEFTKYFSEQWLDGRYWRWQVFHTPVGYATTNNPCETFNAILKKYTGRRRYFMQRLLTVTITVIHDSLPQPPTPDTKIHPPTTATGIAAAAMIAKGRAAAYATQTPTLCRVKQLPKESTGDVQEMEELSAALDEKRWATPKHLEMSS